jgi:hypothetical protein
MRSKALGSPSNRGPGTSAAATSRGRRGRQPLHALSKTVLLAIRAISCGTSHLLQPQRRANLLQGMAGGLAHSQMQDRRRVEAATSNKYARPRSMSLPTPLSAREVARQLVRGHLRLLVDRHGIASQRMSCTSKVCPSSQNSRATQ